MANSAVHIQTSNRGCPVDYRASFIPSILLIFVKHIDVSTHSAAATPQSSQKLDSSSKDPERQRAQTSG